MSATRSRSAGASSRYDCSRGEELILAELRCTAGSPLRITAALCRSVTSTCDSRRAIVRLRLERGDHAAPPAPPAPRRSSIRRRPATPTGRRRSAGRNRRTAGRTRSMITPRSSTRYSSPSTRPIADRLPLRHHDFDRRRQRAPQRRVAHPRRRQQALRASVEVGPHQVFAAQAAQHGQHLAVRQPLVAADDDAIDFQHVGLRPRPPTSGRRRTPSAAPSDAVRAAAA